MPVGRVGDSDTIQNWFNDIPVLTKILFVSTLLSGACTSFGLVSAGSQVLLWDLVVDRFEIWRPFTALIFSGSFSLPFAMHTYLLYLNSRNYETGPFNTGAGGNSADYLWFIIFAASCLLLLSFVFELVILSEAFLFAIIYTWSRKEPDGTMSMFGVKFKAVYLPWVYVAIRLLMGQSITQPLIGIAVGHLFYFLVEVLPVSHNYRIIQTPRFCGSAVARLTGFIPTGFATPTAASQSAAPAASRQPESADGLRFRPGADRRPATYSWGQGRTLGSQ